MGWEELAESLDDLETKEVYDGYIHFKRLRTWKDGNPDGLYNTGCLMCISGKTAAESRAGMPSRI